ncbi:MAG TPA: hypothetical protein VKV20_15465 [Ktedonobacteraceae bacterium]|jgi:hypothetical protein|nr:hypothetical protein [Ktedonobacteraceae bacterium]
MRNITQKASHITPQFVFCLLPLLVLAACAALPPSRGQPASNSQNGQTAVVIDWVDFIKFGGITYVATSPGRPLVAGDLGPVFATIKFKLDGNVQNPNYQSKDGDAAFLNPGTKVYTVKGYKPTFRLTAYQNGEIQLYEADTNPHAKVGADLLDIGGKVLYIGINSPQDGKTELGSIKNSKQVEDLVTMVLNAPVNQNYQSQESSQYFIDFHLRDGTSVIRAYWPDSGELSGGILLPPVFGAAIKQALH